MNSYKLSLIAKAEEAQTALVEYTGGVPTLDVDMMKPVAFQGQTRLSGWENTIFDGGKFAGGFGTTQLQHIDYWTLRQRSSQLFNENLYARGLIRRLITNEINTGLSPESVPDEEVIGVREDSLLDWSETVETRFHLWGKNPAVCDHFHQDTFGAIQRTARREALVDGDVLVVLRQSQRTKMSAVQLIRGASVRTPALTEMKLGKGHTVLHGVERDTSRRVAAYWILQEDGSSKRLPAFGARSGRRLAWLVFGTDKRMDEERGQPLLALVMQSMKEIDRYRDSTQRKATVNSVLAMFIKKGEDKMGTLPMTGGAVRHSQVTETDGDGTPHTRNILGQHPGMVMEELQQGEEPVAFGAQGTDEKFGEFEEAITQAIAWANEIPPEILRLAFSNNYSASQAAINEFKIYLNLVWTQFGEAFCSPIYTDWLISSLLQQKITANGLLAVWRDPLQQDVFTAWVDVEWYGSIKPSTDMLKQAKGSQLLIKNGWSTNAREARGMTGTKFSKNVRRLTRENELLVKAMRPLAEFKQEFGVGPNEEAIVALDDATVALVEVIEDKIDGR